MERLVKAKPFNPLKTIVIDRGPFILPTAFPFILTLMLCIIQSIVRGQAIDNANPLTLVGDTDPVRVTMSNKGADFTYYLENDTYFPFEVELRLTEVANLKPAVSKQTVTAQPGRQLLFILTKIKRKADARLSYKFSSKISPTLSANVDENFPYLVPLTKGTQARLYRGGSAVGGGRLFEAGEGDTVRVMRKGVVTATPDSGSDQLRLAPNSIEILHADGTLAVYRDFNHGSLVKYGEEVVPGQAIGTARKELPINVAIYKLIKGNQFISFPHVYATGDSETVRCTDLKDGSPVVHPENVVMKELSRRETKKVKP